MFSSELTELAFYASQGANVIIMHQEQILLNEIYVPDDQGIIRVLDLDELLEPYLIRNLVEEFIFFIDGDVQDYKQVKVQYCKTEVGTDTSSFLNTFFLSTLMGEKVTTMNRSEFLHLVCQKNTAIQAQIKYRENGTIKTTEKILETIMDPGKVITVEVSPALLEMGDLEILGYTIRAGERLQTYVIDRMDPKSEPDLIFTNSFGCQETIYCQGTFKLEGEFERDQAYIDGRYRTYHVNETRKYKANTGMLTTAMANWAEDLFRSKEIYLLQGNMAGKEITIMESKFVRNNDPDELPSFNFEYRYAQRNQNILYTGMAGRIFDMSFDRTFN